MRLHSRVPFSSSSSSANSTMSSIMLLIVNTIIIMLGASNSVVSAVEVLPKRGNCWHSALDIMKLEATFVLGSTDREVRTYKFCERVVPVGVIDFDALRRGEIAAIGGEFPLVVFNPNFHLDCLFFDCVFTGGKEQVTTLGDEDSRRLVAILLKETFPTATVPVDFYPLVDRLTLSFLTFTNSNGADAVIKISAPGNKMTMYFCTFVNNGLESPNFSAILLDADGNDEEQVLSSLYYSSFEFLEVNNFIGNVFEQSIISTTTRGAQPQDSIISYSLFENTFIDNTITSTDTKTGAAHEFASMFTSFFAQVSYTSNYFENNVIQSAIAPIVMIGSFGPVFGRIEEFADFEIKIIDRRTAGCIDVQRFTVSSDYDSTCDCTINHRYTATGCAYVTPPVQMAPPDGGDCWATTSGILLAEVPAIFNKTLYYRQRAYTLCNATYDMDSADITSAEPLTLGDNFPLVPFIPNMVIECELGPFVECALFGGTQQMFNLVDNSFVSKLLNLVPSVPSALPDGFRADSTNLEVEGLLFVPGPNSFDIPGTVQLDGPGLNMRFKFCVWVADEASAPTQSGLAIRHRTDPATNRNEQFYNAVSLFDCFFGFHPFFSSPITVGFVGVQPTTQLTRLRVRRTQFVSNFMLSTDPDSNAAIVSTSFTDVILDQVVMANNMIAQGRAPVVLINSNLVLANQIVLEGNMFEEDLAPQCTEAIGLDVSSDFNSATGTSENFVYTETGCQRLTPAPLNAAGVFGCFSGSSTVQVLNVGKVNLEDVKIGHRVLVGDNVYEPVYSFGHFSPDTVAKFLRIKTIDETALEITSDHMVFVEGRGAIPAALVHMGDKLVTIGGSKSVKSINTVSARGVFAPFTPSGKMVVDGVVVSSFIVLGEVAPDVAFLGVTFSHHWVAHSFEFPHRVVCHYLGSCPGETYTKEGISTWVARPKDAGIWLLKQGTMLQNILGGIFAGILVLFNVVEMVFVHPFIIFGSIYLVWRLRAGKKEL